MRLRYIRIQEDKKLGTATKYNLIMQFNIKGAEVTIEEGETLTSIAQKLRKFATFIEYQEAIIKKEQPSISTQKNVTNQANSCLAQLQLLKHQHKWR